MESMKHGAITKGVYTKYERESDKLRMGNGSWSIPFSVVRNPLVNKIIYRTDKADYEISRFDANEYGWQLLTQSQELKWVVPLKFWKKGQLTMFADNIPLDYKSEYINDEL